MISLPSTDTNTNSFQKHQAQPLHHSLRTQYQDNEGFIVIDDTSNLDFDSENSHPLLASNLEFLNNTSVSKDSGLMQSDTWGGLAHYTPKIGRFSHHRESSLSSLGSTGPASPFNSNISNPHIAVTDPSFDGLSDMHPQDYSGSQTGSYYQLAKTMAPNSYDSYQALDTGNPQMAYPVTVAGPDKRQRLNKGLLPAPEFSGIYNKSYPTSVTSSVAGGDSPATPAVGEADSSDRRKSGYTHIPKLDRTMTDVYGDELYNPNFTITSGLSPQHHSVMSSTSDVFNQRLSAANSHHLSAAHSPSSTASRARSPFRHGSPFAPSPIHDMAVQHNGQTFNSHNIRDQNRNHQRPLSQVESAGEPETPKTISPKDAVLEFNEVEADGMFPLFPHDSSNFQIDSFTKPVTGAESDGVYLQAHAGSGGINDQFSFIPSQLPTGIQVPQQYPFVSRPSASHETPPRLSSSGASSVASAGHTPNSRPRPLNTGAESGTYTCTYHGCTMRFETPSLLQKHKREGHRQTQGLGAPRVQDMGMTANVLNTQAGPHRCDRINPSTGKPCNTVFSRPYDLTRHEDTIHNARKQKVRCNLCTEEKSFSRADALTRHYRVCHPDMDLPGKNRRRGGS